MRELPLCPNIVCRAPVLPLLYDMGQTITQGVDLRQTTALLLKIMREHLEVVCGMFTLHHSRTGTIFVHESLGLTEEEQARGVYALGEGITGKVVESQKAIIVPRIRDEPNFLGRTHNRDKERLDYSFLCIPILSGQKTLGTISVEKKYHNEAELGKDVDLLTFIAGLIAQAVELHLLKNEEKVYWENENRRLMEALKTRFRPSNIIGSSAPMREVYGMIDKIAKSRATVLILGESGVGKELVANAIHYHSTVAAGPLVTFNCAALPESIVESELFGHEKGSFTGAEAQRKGRFEEADGGTIFLDEVGELSLGIQAKLLRVLQERMFERVGGNKSVKVTIRIIAATNRDLAEMVAEGRFREDLYYRLNVFPITIPPLRERGSDIITLSDHFAIKFAKENNKPVHRISTSAQQMLLNYPWPGNVRELENVMERAVILSEDEVIHGYDFPPSLQAAALSEAKERTLLEAKLEAVEHEYIVEALRNSGGNLSETAISLGMTRRILGLRLKRLNIDYRLYRKRQTVPAPPGISLE